MDLHVCPLLRVQLHYSHAGVGNKNPYLGAKELPGSQNGRVYALVYFKYLVPSSTRLSMRCGKYLVPCLGSVQITK